MVVMRRRKSATEDSTFWKERQRWRTPSVEKYAMGRIRG